MIPSLLKQIPKTELHIHIEGALEPELMFQLAEKNHVKLPYKTIDEVRQAYQFHNLQSFLDLYYQGSQVLLTEEDFYELTWAYLTKAHKQNIRHVELFFDPQAHTQRGIAFEVVFHGIQAALKAGQKELGISFEMIPCFLRHLSEADAFKTLEQLIPYKKDLIAIGLDSSEQGNPPDKFVKVFKKAHDLGFLTVAHAGEECGPESIWNTLKLLKIARIDHGIQAIQDDKLIDYLAEQQIPLTVCPLSNIKLCVFDDMTQHPIKTLLDRGVCVTVNSDDPAYFGGYLLENYESIVETLNLNQEDVYKLASNAIQASFLRKEERQHLVHKLNQVYPG